VAGAPSSKDQERLGAVGAATGIGCSIVVTLIVMIGGGIVLDRVTGMSPVFTLIGVAVGLIGAGYELYELAQIGRKERAPGPLARGLSELAARRQVGDAAGPSRPRRPDEPDHDEE
jgi:hypothetical protein